MQFQMPDVIKKINSYVFVLSVTSFRGGTGYSLLYAYTPLESLYTLSMLYIVIFQIVQ